MRRIHVIGILACITSVAQLPNAFKYQAVARNNKGELIAGPRVSFRIGIIQGDVQGASAYTEKHADTINAFGLVNLEIGNGITEDDFSSIDWSEGKVLFLMSYRNKDAFIIDGTMGNLGPNNHYPIFPSNTKLGWDTQTSYENRNWIFSRYLLDY